jgi:NADP-reducing hydrogenase subunit HndB
MEKIQSVADLKKFQARYQARMAARSEKVCVNVSLATCGIASGGKAVMAALQDELARQGITNVEFMQSGCMTYCHSEPTVEVTLPGKEPVVFGHLDEASARELVRKYIKGGELVPGVVPVNYVRVVL